MSDKEPHCHEYSGRNLTEVTCDGKTVEEILETLPQTDSHAPMLFVFDAIDTPMCTGPFLRHEGIRTFSVFLEKVTNSPNLAVIAVTQSFTMLDDLATGESVNVAVTHDAFPKNACEYHAMISASIPMPFSSWKNGSRCPMVYVSSPQSCIGWRYSKIRR